VGLSWPLKETVPWLFIPGSFRNLPGMVDATSRGALPSSVRDREAERLRGVSAAASASSSWRCHCSGQGTAFQPAAPVQLPGLL
uniref:Uncharacterized protein n=1 Tax=Monodon monoceros TaxID=40151 RepID=A0A8C6AJX1_MONMO